MAEHAIARPERVDVEGGLGNVGEQGGAVVERERDGDVGALVLGLGQRAGAAERAVGDRRDAELIGAHGDERCRRRSRTLWPPMKRATNSVRGWWKISRGVPGCSILPWFITTMRSASAIASSWPWVTWMKRDAELVLQPLQLAAHLDPQERVERGQRLVEQEIAAR